MNIASEAPKRSLIQKYRNVFSHPEANDVLGHMLYELGVFDELDPTDVQHMALRNYGTRLLKILGGGVINISSAVQLIQGLKTQALEPEKEEEL